MRNFARWLGIIAFIAVIGFSFASCKKDSLDGTTWKATLEHNNYVLAFKSPNLTITYNDQETVTGTYTVSGDTVTMVCNGETETGTLAGNELSFADGPVFTKQ